MTMNIDFGAPVVEETIEELFRLLLGRPVNNESFTQKLIDRNISVRDLAEQILTSPEFEKRFLVKKGIRLPSADLVDGYTFRVPTDLTVKRSSIAKVLIIGSCLMNDWGKFIGTVDPAVKLERITFNNASRLPEMDAATASSYEFQILQVPLRSVLPEGVYYGLRFDDTQGYERMFEFVVSSLEKNVTAILAYHAEFNIESYILNFTVPQQNPMGRLQDRYALSNMVFFIESLNMRLYDMCRGKVGVHVVDFDQIVSTYGRKYFQDDSVVHTNHASYLHSIQATGDKARLEPVGDLKQLLAPNVEKVIAATYHEIVAMHRSIRQDDSIKIVIFDLDDTLWRGVAAEEDEVGPHLAEGWPLGILEAVSFLWRRGLLVALVSKNDEDTVKRIWRAIYEKKFPFSNFVATRINWLPKPENIKEVLSAVNLLPQNALFVDDNPLERAGALQALPGIRVIDAPLAHWRRILLWSSETQVATVTDESISRTNMMQAQIKRDGDRVSMGHSDFVRSLNVSTVIKVIRDQGHVSFARCFELINKTNQFNTTGRRWSLSEMIGWLADGGYIVACEAEDRYTNYGIIGVAVIRADLIEQYVMSCRVFGMEIERAVIVTIVNIISDAGYGVVRANLRSTDKNALAMPTFSGYRLFRIRRRPVDSGCKRACIQSRSYQDRYGADRHN